MMNLNKTVDILEKNCTYVKVYNLYEFITYNSMFYFEIYKINHNIILFNDDNFFINVFT